MPSLIERLTELYSMKLRQARAVGLAPSGVADGLVEEATHLVDAIAFIPPTSPRDALIQAVAIAHHLNDHFDPENEAIVPLHALARSVVAYLAQQAGVDTVEITAMFSDGSSECPSLSTKAASVSGPGL